MKNNKLVCSHCGRNEKQIKDETYGHVESEVNGKLVHVELVFASPLHDEYNTCGVMVEKGGK